MKNTALKFINPILAFLLLLTVTFVTLYKFGPAVIRYSESLGELHEFAGTLFVFVGLIHIYYNWSWVRTNILGKKGKHKSPKN
ncbi:MAG: hypothetical protein PHY48_11170 [Candidatus Cloacimonetes bacterium]|nr:hypothetical protein [Candidatus Cloacimonadota bacterium]